MKMLIVNDSTENCPEDFLHNWVESFSQELIRRNVITEDLNRKELSVVFLDEKDAKRINWQYRSKDYATDVLSFATDDPDAIGELVMCPQVLKKQAVDNKLTYENEVTRMIVHGVLHLLGYDHELSPEDDKKMMALQEQILIALEAPREKKRHLKLVSGETEKKKVSAKVKKAASAMRKKAKSVKVRSSRSVKAKKK